MKKSSTPTASEILNRASEPKFTIKQRTRVTAWLHSVIVKILDIYHGI